MKASKGHRKAVINGGSVGDWKAKEFGEETAWQRRIDSIDAPATRLFCTGF